jgi:hypothetical protein
MEKTADILVLERFLAIDGSIGKPPKIQHTGSGGHAAHASYCRTGAEDLFCYRYLTPNPEDCCLRRPPRGAWTLLGLRYCLKERHLADRE